MSILNLNTIKTIGMYILRKILIPEEMNDLYIYHQNVWIDYPSSRIEGLYIKPSMILLSITIYKPLVTLSTVPIWKKSNRRKENQICQFL